jgi:hypothetical protein
MSKLTESSRGEPCQLRLEGCFSGVENNTVVFCHLSGGGMGKKMMDFQGFYGCFNCHSKYDAREPHNYEKEWLELEGYRAMIRTQIRMVAKGLL